MPISKTLIATVVVGALALAAGVAALALDRQDTGGASPKGVQLALTPHETDAGVCRPERIAKVNKQDTGLHAVYGDVRLIDVRDETATKLPLQLVFTGWNSEGMSEERVTTGINTKTPCTDLKIVYTIKECLYDNTRPKPMACPKVEAVGKGFSMVSIEEDRSQSLPRPD